MAAHRWDGALHIPREEGCRSLSNPARAARVLERRVAAEASRQPGAASVLEERLWRQTAGWGPLHHPTWSNDPFGLAGLLALRRAAPRDLVVGLGLRALRAGRGLPGSPRRGLSADHHCSGLRAGSSTEASQPEELSTEKSRRQQLHGEFVVLAL